MIYPGPWKTLLFIHKYISRKQLSLGNEQYIVSAINGDTLCTKVNINIPLPATGRVHKMKGPHPHLDP